MASKLNFLTPWISKAKAAIAAGAKPKASSIVFVSRADEMDLLKINNIKRVALSGSSIVTTFDEVPPHGYHKLYSVVPQKPKFGFMMPANARKVNFFVESAVSYSIPKSVMASISAESYITYGVHAKTNNARSLVMIGGREHGGDTGAEVYYFEDGALAEVAEVRLPSQDANYFIDSLTSKIGELKEKYRGADVYVCAPLNDPTDRIPGIGYISEDQIFKKPKYVSLAESTGSTAKAFVIPLLIAGVAAANYAYTLKAGWNNLGEAEADYHKEMKDPVISANGGVNSELINKMEKRKLMLVQARPQEDIPEYITYMIMAASTVPGAEVKKIKVMSIDIKNRNQAEAATQESIQNAMDGRTASNVPLSVQGRRQFATQGAPVGTPGAEEEKPNMIMRISVPQAPGSSIDQGAALIQELSDKTGIHLRIEKSGWNEEAGRRFFNIEGFIYAKP